MSKDRLKVGIIGSMFAAELHMSAYRRLPHVEVAAVAAKTVEEAKPFADKYGITKVYGDYQQLLALPEIDLVSVAVPNFLHHDVVLAVCQAKKHMICEKPLATSVADAEDMAAAVRKSGVKFMYAEDWIFAPSLLRAKQIVDEGGIGNVLFVKAKECHNGSHSLYAQQKKYCGGGAMIHLGIHPLGWVRWLKNQDVVEVLAKVSGGEGRNLLHKNYTGEDWSCAVLTFADGAVAFIEGNYITWGGIDDRIEIYGSEGNLHVNLTQGSPVTCYSRPGIKYAIEKADMTVGWTKPAVDEWWQLGYCDEVAHFVDCVRFDKEVARGVRLEDGVACMRILEAIYESAATGKAVKVKQG
jgi:predicted dehydrogenase